MKVSARREDGCPNVYSHVSPSFLEHEDYARRIDRDIAHVMTHWPGAGWEEPAVLSFTPRHGGRLIVQGHTGHTAMRLIIGTMFVRPDPIPDAPF